MYKIGHECLLLTACCWPEFLGCPMTFIVLHDLYNFRLFSMNMNHHQLRAQKGFNFKRASYRGKHLKRKKKQICLLRLTFKRSMSNIMFNVHIDHPIQWLRANPLHQSRIPLENLVSPLSGNKIVGTTNLFIGFSFPSMKPFRRLICGVIKNVRSWNNLIVLKLF